MTLRRPRVLRAAWERRAEGDPALGWAFAVAKEAERQLAALRQEAGGLRRREARQRREAQAEGAFAAAEALLEGVDALDSALAGPEPPEGLALVRDALLASLSRMGAEEVPGVGSPLDPAVHEVVGGEGNKVAKTLRRGLRLAGRLVRPAMVEVE